MVASPWLMSKFFVGWKALAFSRILSQVAVQGWLGRRGLH
jgi:hypothetical protein